MRSLLLFSIAILVASLCHGAGSGSDPLKEYSCSLSVQTKEGDAQAMEAPGLSVLNPPPDQAIFVAEAGDDVAVNGVLCWRSRAEFVPSDYRVLAAGYPLYVKHDDAGPNQGRALVLEEVAGVYQIRLIAGPELSTEERQAMDKVIEQFNAKSHAAGAANGND